MKPPESLETLVDYGIIQEVVRPLMSGKEAQIYLVVAGGEECVAKVYKEARHRSFKHRSEYTEGRRTRNSRDQRAITKRTQHGRMRDEAAWRSTEVDMIHRLRDAGVRVPEPINFVDGVLVMELVTDSSGEAAPRLGDLTFSAEKAREIHQTLMRSVVRMLCAGVVHGDLSEFNVLMGAKGPVVIDFPQSVDPTQNANAGKLLRRDVDNLQRFLNRFAPEDAILPYGEEIWSLFQANQLEPETKLTGRYVGPQGKSDTAEVLALIDDANREQRLRRDGRDSQGVDHEIPPKSPVIVGRGGVGNEPTPFRRVVDFSAEHRPRRPANASRSSAAQAPEKRSRGAKQDRSSIPAGPAADLPSKDNTSPQRRRRRRRRSSSKSASFSDPREIADRSKTEPRADSGGKSAGPSKRSSKVMPPGNSGRAVGEFAKTDGTSRRRRRRTRKPRSPG